MTESWEGKWNAHFSCTQYSRAGRSSNTVLPGEAKAVGEFQRSAVLSTTFSCSYFGLSELRQAFIARKEGGRWDEDRGGGTSLGVRVSNGVEERKKMKILTLFFRPSCGKYMFEVPCLTDLNNCVRWHGSFQGTSWHTDVPMSVFFLVEGV